jgi:hypothetical protein
MLAVVRGSLLEGLLVAEDGFDAIAHRDCRRWLMDHGASKDSVNSAFVRGLHDLALAYENGVPDPDHMAFSAAEGLRGAFRAFFNYRGAFFWKMQAGMGDVVFAPFYEVLRRRGVRFEFFHRLRNVRVTREPDTQPGGQPHVSALEFYVQADVIDGQEYRRPVDVRVAVLAVHGLSQLTMGLPRRQGQFESHWEDHSVRRKTARPRGLRLRRPRYRVGSAPLRMPRTHENSKRWREMVANVKTVATQAVQIWMNEDMETLGWNNPRLSSLSAFVDPFGTWADMTHLIAHEGFQSGDGVRGVLYACGQLGHGEDPVAACDPSASDPLSEPAESRRAVAEGEEGLTSSGGVARRLEIEDGIGTAAADEQASTAAPERQREPVRPILSVNRGKFRLSHLAIGTAVQQPHGRRDWTACNRISGVSRPQSWRAASRLTRSKHPALEDIVGLINRDGRGGGVWWLTTSDFGGRCSTGPRQSATGRTPSRRDFPDNGIGPGVQNANRSSRTTCASARRALPRAHWHRVWRRGSQDVAQRMFRAASDLMGLIEFMAASLGGRRRRPRPARQPPSRRSQPARRPTSGNGRV